MCIFTLGKEVIHVMNFNILYQMFLITHFSNKEAHVNLS